MPSGRGATAATSALLVVSAATAIGIGYIHRTQRLEREVNTVQNYDITARNCVQLMREFLHGQSVLMSGSPHGCRTFIRVCSGTTCCTQQRNGSTRNG